MTAAAHAAHVRVYTSVNASLSRCLRIPADTDPAHSSRVRIEVEPASKVSLPPIWLVSRHCPAGSVIENEMIWGTFRASSREPVDNLQIVQLMRLLYHLGFKPSSAEAEVFCWAFGLFVITTEQEDAFHMYSRVLYEQLPTRLYNIAAKTSAHELPDVAWHIVSDYLQTDDAFSLFPYWNKVIARVLP